MTFHVAGSKVRMARMDFTDTILTVMNKITKNKIAMYKAVRSIIENHEAIWTNLPAFSQSRDAFIEKLNELEQKSYAQSLALIGVSAAKDAKKQIAIERTYAISSGLVAFATMSNNPALLEQMNVKKKDIFQASKTNLLLIIDRVIAKATEFGNELTDFGVDQQSVAELKELRDELEIQFNAPRNAIIERKGYTQQIKALRIELDRIIKFQLDKLILVFETEHPEFFTAYKNARVIVDHKNRPSGNASLPPERDDGFRPTRFGEEDPE